jgi:hypothetical protein
MKGREYSAPRGHSANEDCRAGFDVAALAELRLGQSGNLPISAKSQTTMVGGGNYDQSARHQRTAVALALPLLARAAERVPLPEVGAPFVFVDYGSATGFNTFAPARQIVSAVRRRAGTSVPVCRVARR